MVIDFSVVIYARNAVETLGRAIESVLSQTHPPKEIIVVDDGSNDATSEVAKMYGEVILLRQKPMGQAASYNNGVFMAESEWIAFLDAADAWAAQKLETHIGFHKRARSSQVSYSDRLRGDLYERALERNLLQPSALVIKKSLFATLQGYDESLESAALYDFWLRTMKAHKVEIIDAQLVIFGSEPEDAALAFQVRSLEALYECYPDDRTLLHVMIEKYRHLYAEALGQSHDETAFHAQWRIGELETLQAGLI